MPAEPAGRRSRSTAPGLTGPDGPTHHGVLRHRRTCGSSRTWSSWPPATRPTCAPMLRLRARARRPDRRCAIRRRTWRRSSGQRAPPIELGKAEVIAWGEDGVLRRLRHAAPELRRGRGEAARPRGSTSASSTPASSSRSTRRRSCGRSRRCRSWSRSKKGRSKAASARRVLEAANAAGLDTRNVVRLRHPGPLHRARRARRTAGRLRPQRRETRRHGPVAQRSRSGRASSDR